MVNAHINNKMEKMPFVELVDIYQGETTQEDLRKVNNLGMKSAIKRYVGKVFSSTSGNVQAYLNELQTFESIKFVTPFYLNYYHDTKAHYLQRAFGRDLSMKIMAYGQ